MAGSDTPIQVSQATVPVDMLRPNPWNTNHMSPENEAKLDASLKRFGGLYKPVVVRTLDDGSLEILGGEHRWESAKRMGLTEVPIINVGRISDKAAKEIGLVDNGRYGEDDTLALSRLLKELGDDVGEFLPYTDTELSDILLASNIDLDSLDSNDAPEMPELPSAGATHQVMRFKVPVEDVAWITSAIDRAAREQGFTQEDSMTNAGNAFVHLMKAYK
ncbi:ParB/RepB/Spo0J family partition protein [Burkholderia vietnamiensis]|uniref:ParB/RepB/Spo0J family partition protein n=1 Tax=Burkholderia vietnamiensis TaxID=60552 RepID=UPI001CB0D344|nr:ParB/RepB/Spo0J family partition protein [Burkholderia vietnamiensis]CAG9228753.1 Putative ParB domain protein [Burkholderia vietnamiensis]HDR9086378.1 ParB N-terminal domain-containing protein [Burkholderia vietnamiensis]